MAFQNQQQVYGSSTGTALNGRNWVFDRNPTSNDVTPYQIGDFWQNTATENLWYLNSFSSSNAVLQADWVSIGSSIASLSDTSDTPVYPSSGLSTPPNNIQLINLDGAITIISDPPANRIIFGLTGGSEAVDSFQPDTGTNPVVPDSNGLVKVLGQSTPNVSGIRVTGAANELDIAMYSPFSGDFTFIGNVSASKNASGTSNIFFAENTSTNANSSAGLVVGVPVSGNANVDPFIILGIGGVTNWHVAIDQSDSGSFVIGNSATIGASNRLKITTSGAITFDGAYTFPTSDGSAGQVLTTNGAGVLSFQNSGSGSWSTIGASQTLAVNQAYICSSGGALSLALPAVSNLGDTIQVVLNGSTSFEITQGAGQQIRIGNQTTTLGATGTISSTQQGDWIELVCQTADLLWVASIKSGNLTVA